MSRGSTWSVWDLHIHSPESFVWQGDRFEVRDAQGQRDLVAEMVGALNAAEPVAFAFQDYWTFSGYHRFKTVVQEDGLPLGKLVLPGVELRVSSPTNFRLNLHVIFSDSVPADDLDGFLARLRILGQGQPLNRSNIIRFARELPRGVWRRHGGRYENRADDAECWHLGVQTVEVEATSVTEALATFRRDQYVVMQPYDTSDGLEGLAWEDHPAADSFFMRLGDIFETRKTASMELFHGIVTDQNSAYVNDFQQNLGGKPKPVTCGSDAHTIHPRGGAVRGYGQYPRDVKGWFKGAPRFSTILHALADPAARAWVGVEHPTVDRNRRLASRLIDWVEIRPVDGASGQWFNQRLELNAGLVVVIGNKGSGKSALADTLALAGNAHTQEFSFLTADRFRRPPVPAREYRVQVGWRNGEVADPLPLTEEPDLARPERVRYLSQNYVEEVCNNVDETPDSPFERALRKVILQHLPPEVRQGAATLREVMERVASVPEERLLASRRELAALNLRITTLEDGVSEEAVGRLSESLRLKQGELAGHDAGKPAEVEAPRSDDPDRVATQAEAGRLRQSAEDLQTALSQSEDGLRAAVVRRSGLVSFKGMLQSLDADVNARTPGLEEAAGTLGIEARGLIRLEIAWDRVDAALEEVVAEEGRRTAEIGTPDSGGLMAQLAAARANLLMAQTALGETDRAYEDYLNRLRVWEQRRALIVGGADQPESLAGLQARLTNVTTTIEATLPGLYERRRDLSRSIHGLLRNIRDSWAGLFVPVQRYIADQPVANEQGFEFAVRLGYSRIRDELLNYINQGRVGVFQGVEAGRRALSEFMTGVDFDHAESTCGFADRVFGEFAGDDISRRAATMDRQMSGGRPRSALLDYLFGLAYLDPFFTLTRNGRELRLLSPGERGATLLVFYLLVDPEDCPLVVDQPEQNLDNQTVFQVLVPAFRAARERRQVVMITHNPNLAVVCDADQVIRAELTRSPDQIRYAAGGLEDEGVARQVVDVLEGTMPAFRSRDERYLVAAADT